MAAGINISFASDVRAFLSGTRDIEKGMDDVGDSLDDLARESDQAARRVQDDLEQTGREGEGAAEKLERSFRDSFDVLRRESQQAERATRDDFRKIERSGSEATGEFRDEAKQNFSEVTSSFQGDMDSVADLAQGTFGGLASMGGPIGLASGAIAAAGGAFYTAWKNNAEKSKQAVDDMYDDMLESGLSYLSDSFVMEGVSKIVTGADDAAISLEKAQGYANDLGVGVETVAAAWAGSKTAQDEVTAAIEEQRAALLVLNDEEGQRVDTQLWGLGEIEGALGNVTAAHETATDKVKIARDAAYEYTSQYEELKTALDNSVGFYGGRDWSINVKADVDLEPAKRELQRFLDGSYQVRVNGRLEGMRYE